MSLRNGDMVRSLDTLGTVGIVVDTDDEDQRVCVVLAWNFYTWPFWVRSDRVRIVAHPMDDRVTVPTESSTTTR